MHFKLYYISMNKTNSFDFEGHVINSEYHTL